MGDNATKHISLSAVVRRLWSFVPLGGSLPEDVWRERHRFLLGLTWFHAVIIALVGPVLGYSWELSLDAIFHDGTVAHTIAEGLIVAVFAALAGWRKASRTFQATTVGFGLMSSSAILVHLSGGYIELHFHFFVMLAFLALYQDWVPYLLAVVYVAIHHGVVGVLWPEEVYNHTAALNAPWTWAGIHAVFVLWASVGSVIAWRFNEIAFAQTKLILGSAGEGIYGLDLDGRTTFINPAAAKMLGYEVEELIGQSMHGVLHHTRADGSPYPSEECPIYAAFKDGTIHRVTDEVFWRKGGTSFPVDYVSTPIIERGQLTGAVVTFSDITERKRVEEEIRTLNIELEQRVTERTAQLEVANTQLQEAMHGVEEASRHKSEFLANMSHELRTPLNSVIGFSELLEDQNFGPLNAKQVRYVHNIWTSGQHLLHLINDILDLSKVEAGKIELKPEPFSLPEALAAALNAIRPQAEAKGLQLALSVEGCPATLEADPTRFKQFLYNLLSNAVKFTPVGGSVTLAARVQRPTSNVQSLKEADVGHWTLDAAGFVEILVQDTGIGIKAEDLPKLFQPFTQLETFSSKHHQGTGLGLALTKRLVELHGGRIWVESEGGNKGTTFTVALPLRPPQKAKPRLLLVDDDMGLVEALVTALQQEGYELEVAANGTEALAMVEQRPPDLLLLDLKLPGCDGRDILAALRALEATQRLPVIVFTGAEGITEAEIKKLGAQEFLTKPFSTTVLLQVIGRLLNHSHSAIPSHTPPSV